MKYFYDTNVLLQGDKKFFNQQNKFYISNITIEELENIKTSYSKDENIKYQARKAVHWLSQNQQQFEIILYDPAYSSFSVIDSNDKKIIITAIQLQKTILEPLIFVTYDLNCQFLAKTVGLNVDFKINTNLDIEYTGYKKLFCKNDLELANFYSSLKNIDIDLNINEYLLIYDKNNNLIDKYKCIDKHQLGHISFITANSKMFGNIKPIDPYQELVMDSLKHNQLTLIKGPAGTGKSLLSLAYLFKLLEDSVIDKIIIFCNTVATAGSAKLGFYPGSRTEKLLDSQIGNFLISKLGAREEVERLIDNGMLLLLPMSDIRGFDTSGMRAGIYITEAQNLNIELMKLALQRIGEDSICILDGDNEAQVDLGLYAGNNNGLKRVSQVFRGQPFYGEITLKTIHRSKIAQIASQM